ncbi:MAG: DUF2442 domain-containing protein [Bacteroidales bacterium]|nr:DUF2442 domain-containing protein [Bacteroidales bacterium]
MKITRIWFDKRFIYGENSEGKVYKQSLLWYPELAEASLDQRLDFKTGFEGFHWPSLGVDISFESFEYEDALPTPLQSFFLTHKEINISAFGKFAGINPTLIRDYINGFKKPSQRRVLEIQEAIRKLGAIYSQVDFE